MQKPPTEIDRLRLERDLFLRLLELGARDDLRPFLEDALRLIVEVTRAQKGYLEVSPGSARGDPPFWIAMGFDDARFRGHASVQAQRLQAVLCAPVGADPSIGVVYLAGRDAPGPFPEED